jgi:hypothetical protein
MKAISSLLVLVCLSIGSFAQQKKIALVFNCEEYQESGLNITHKTPFILDFQKYLVSKNYDIQIVNNPLAEEIPFELKRVQEYFSSQSFPDGSRLDVFVFGRAFSRLGKSYLLPKNFNSESPVETSVDLCEIEDLMHNISADEINLCFDLLDGGIHQSAFLYRWAISDNLNHLESNLRFSLSEGTYRNCFFSIQEDVEKMPVKLHLEFVSQKAINEEDPYKAELIKSQQ